MKNVFRCSLGFGSLLLLTGLGSEQSAGREGRRQQTDFSGTLVTVSSDKQEKQYNMRNISVSGIIKDIRFFELPSAPVGSKLSDNPHEGAVFEINLEKNLIIEVPRPLKIWTYQRSERASKVEYFAIVVTPCDKGEKKEYIVETTRSLLGEELGSCDPIVMKIPLNQIVRLEITDSQPWQEQRPCPIKSPVAPDKTLNKK